MMFMCQLVQLAACYQSCKMPSNQHRQLCMFCLVKEMPRLPSALKLSFKSIKHKALRMANLISPLFSQELLFQIFLLCNSAVVTALTGYIPFRLEALNAPT